MKVKRQKQARKILNVYKTIFNFHEPYLILIDGTFCQNAIKFKIDLKDSISKYFGSDIQCCTTKCVLNELKELGDVTKDATMLAQRFQIRHCGHKPGEVTAAQCILSLLCDPSKGKFFLATQDPGLTKYVQSQPGLPLLYIYRGLVILEKLSKPTLYKIGKVSRDKLSITEEQHAKLKEIKAAKQQELNKMQSNNSKKNFNSGKKRKAKGPNPLSCKKKKKT